MSLKKNEKEKMLEGKLYQVNEELRQLHLKAFELTRTYNLLSPQDKLAKETILKQLFGSVGENIYLEPTIKCDYGFNIKIGNNFYANFDCVFLDVNTISFGDNVFIGPRCCFFTAGHPIDKDIRNEQLEYGYPIKVGNDVWFGGGVIVNPGVTIGNNVVIGSGSVVTNNIPDGVVAAGNPCRVIRKITEKDKEFWEKERNQS